MLRPAAQADVPAMLEMFYLAMPLPPEHEDFGAGHRRWLERRFAQGIALDGAGSWVAEDDDGIAGIGLAHIREGIWVLTLLAVRPDAQSGGVGRELFDRCRAYGDGARAWMVAASEDARGWRLYAGSGLRLLPTVEFDGQVRRERIPAVGGVRAGDREDLDFCVEVDRRVRGGGRRLDLELLLDVDARLWLSDGGYALSFPDRLLMLAAGDEAEAEALLWTCLGDAADRYNACWISADQQWAVRVGLAAGIPLRPTGPYLVGGELGPLAPWIPHGAFL
jgi:GNAT superfamily N-acetyltransferase